MAELSTEDRQRIWRALQRYWSQLFEETAFDKAILLTTVEETDAFLDSIRTSYINSLTYFSDFSGAQVALLFGIVALMRKEPGAEFVRRALGVDTEA
jgi:hypothetical protein